MREKLPGETVKQYLQFQLREPQSELTELRDFVRSMIGFDTATHNAHKTGELFEIWPDDVAPGDEIIVGANALEAIEKLIRKEGRLNAT